jgi:hypothetical protein
MPDGDLLVRLSAWLALAVYPAGPFGIASTSAAGRRRGRWIWTAGCALFLLHLVTAFGFTYRWSHAVALQDTARRTAELTGFDSGFGLYLNYLFAALWIADALWWWAKPASYQARSRGGLLLVHGFFLFMIVNGAVVFVQGPLRFLGGIVTAVGLWGVWRAARSAS